MYSLCVLGRQRETEGSESLSASTLKQLFYLESWCGTRVSTARIVFDHCRIADTNEKMISGQFPVAVTLVKWEMKRRDRTALAHCTAYRLGFIK